MGASPPEPPPDVESLMSLSCITKCKIVAPEVVWQLAPVDLECLSSRQGGSPYSLSQHLLNFLLSGVCSHLRVADVCND